MELSIIIVNWNSAALCADCLKSIYADPPHVPFEIVVIDNASFDGCESMLSRRFPQVRFLQSQTNVGFAGANNLAFSASSGETVCFLNPDTLVRGAALRTLFDALHRVPDGGAVGALLLNGDGSLQTSCVLPFPTVLNQALDIEWLKRRFPRSGFFGASALFSGKNEPQIVEAVSGACIMIPKKLFREIGMFSFEYFMYCEDVDLCKKIKMTGHKVYLVTTAEIVHFGGGSSKELKNALFGAMLARDSNYRFLRKFRGYGYALLYRLILGGMGLLRITGLIVCILPALFTGHFPEISDILRRWWHLLLWSMGFNERRINSFLGRTDA
jgi:GT2 family glycosyltransferase